MRDKLSIVSYTLATVEGLCFVSGLVILSKQVGGDDMERLEDLYPCQTIL